MATYGRHHLDYLVSVTIGTLRKYEQWCRANNRSIQVSPGIAVMVNEARLSPDNAERLHEMFVRSLVYQGKGASVYEGKARVVGEALPNAYGGY